MNLNAVIHRSALTDCYGLGARTAVLNIRTGKTVPMEVNRQRLLQPEARKGGHRPGRNSGNGDQEQRGQCRWSS